jgi:acetolactate synthase I/II/III large subunit
MPNAPKRTGGRILADQLALHGAKLIFGVPGESYLPVIDALYDYRETMPFVACRQEGGASMMAEAYGKLTGEPGICMVTRGPGATSASAGVHVARQDSTPMILFIGQIKRGFTDRGSFQEVDFRQMYVPLAKWAAQIEDAARIPEYVSRAFHVAVSGRPGPVVLALPEDMLSDEVEAADPHAYRRAEAHPSPEDMERLRELLAAAKRPLVLVGGSGWDAAASARVQAFAGASGLPVAASFRRQDYFDNEHPSYVGDAAIGMNPKLSNMIREADLLLAVGARLSEIATGAYSLVEIPTPRQRLIHVHADPGELGWNYQADLPIAASPRGFAAALETVKPLESPAWSAWTGEARKAYEEWRTPVRTLGSLQLAEIVSWLRDALPDDAILVNGAGNFSVWVHRFFRYRQFGTQLAPVSGSMGYGVPAAVAAKLLHPGREVVSFSGDGCFLMHGQEFATAVQHRAPAIFIVVNNGIYGTIRMHQERGFPGRVYGSDLHNPDFAAYARAFGGFGATVEKTEDFAGAFEAARASGLPAILELKLAPEVITPRQTLSGIRAQALEAGRG